MTQKTGSCHLGRFKMKTVKYQGMTVEVEDWVNFIATDEDGEICGFENKPSVNMYGSMWLERTGRFDHIDYTFANLENSLEEI